MYSRIGIWHYLLLTEENQLYSYSLLGISGMGISNQSAVWINDFSRFSKILPEDPMSRAMMDGDAL